MNAALGAYNKLKEVGMGICACLYEVLNNYIVPEELFLFLQSVGCL